MLEQPISSFVPNRSSCTCMWNLQIMVFNSRTDQEYRICHSAIMDRADVNLILNGGMHYSTGGK